MQNTDEATHSTLRTLVELCLLLGLGLASLSQILFIFPWDMLVLATGAIFFVVGYVGIKLLAEKGKRGRSISEVILVLGFTFMATGIFVKLWIITALGIVTMASVGIPHLISSIQGTWSYFPKTYREISQKEQEQMRPEKHV